MPNVRGLVCRGCGKRFKAEAEYRCDVCFSPLDVDYLYAKVKKAVTRKRIQRGEAGIQRYAEFLPADMNRRSGLSAGMTPLHSAARLGEILGIRNLYLKDDTCNPTFSSKDRMVSVALARGVELGFRAFACASSGNLAHSLAAHAARAGVKCRLLVPSGASDAGLEAAVLYGAEIEYVDGGVPALNSRCGELMSSGEWAFVNVNLRAYYSEGAKTISYEIAEQLGWELPHHVFVPVGSGATIHKMKKGFAELVDAELVKESKLRMHGAQAAKCSTVAAAFLAGSDIIKPAQPGTIAKSLAVSNPADGMAALGAIRDSGGSAYEISEEEILQGVKLLAEKEGIFADPAGGAALMAAKKAADSKTFRATDIVVVYVSGHGGKILSLARKAAGVDIGSFVAATVDHGAAVDSEPEAAPEYTEQESAPEENYDAPEQTWDSHEAHEE